MQVLQPQGTNISIVTKGATGNHKQIQTIQARQTPCPARVSGTKTLANPDKNHFLAKARRNSFRTTMPISSTFWCHKRNEINIRQTLGIDIRKEPSRNETTRLDEIREGHRKEIRTIQPTLDTWTA
ncbi:hypothetical protein HGM15179_004934 [Zosterops borbonicus]|uniref:Uncharacterized protein n=1 Tax=Zosterops borbonicus TaxID=364589 RepID=A0A8K1GR97_9PASS|nr:hypothetical protein HGM15179_004934 [Zosterops borbonicus]